MLKEVFVVILVKFCREKNIHETEDRHFSVCQLVQGG